MSCLEKNSEIPLSLTETGLKNLKVKGSNVYDIGFSYVRSRKRLESTGSSSYLSN